MPEHSEGERETDLPVFDAQRPNFQSFYIGLEDYIQSTLKVSYIPLAVQAAVEVLLSTYHDAARHNIQFSSNLDDHEIELKTAMSTKGVCCVTPCITRPCFSYPGNTSIAYHPRDLVTASSYI